MDISAGPMFFMGMAKTTKVISQLHDRKTSSGQVVQMSVAKLYFEECTSLHIYSATLLNSKWCNLAGDIHRG